MIECIPVPCEISIRKGQLSTAIFVTDSHSFSCAVVLEVLMELTLFTPGKFFFAGTLQAIDEAQEEWSQHEMKLILIYLRGMKLIPSSNKW